MRFRSERERQLAADVVKQMIALGSSLQQRMARLLLDALCMQDLALGEAAKQLELPRWDRMPFPHPPELPAIRWKLQNLAKLKGAKRTDQVERLEACFQREGGAL